MQRVLIHIHGIVQGVGFRPFIHKLVKERGLRGYIKNTSSGVELELEGEHEELSGFIEDIPRRAPKLALDIWYTDADGNRQRNLISVCKDCHETVCHPERMRRCKSAPPLTRERWD